MNGEDKKTDKREGSGDKRTGGSLCGPADGVREVEGAVVALEERAHAEKCLEPEIRPHLFMNLIVIRPWFGRDSTEERVRRAHSGNETSWRVIAYMGLWLVEHSPVHYTLVHA